MDYKVFSDKSEKELLDLIEEYKAKLFTLRFKNQTGTVEKTHHIRAIKKDIARALTALNALRKGEK
ncbi:50S ribosomal protein L29 [Mycoplasma phocimorsus]|uniref:Large ribosomal subunit protein uL29 n=1 Tax=Mycoplasma phocimorsus TaxID=3045839 RepID=A0AAJ1UVQ8_9MOLU|nr:50S ribosomal protein L29 [Mycoplasma phocimorsus]MDJ1645794.1 50S ribosomal protein L29 [Mycoplasma phocimorsus]MDJ1646486.1 50S ribosomal protein L29 [Mycoplasma phocimorsus]MDJ1646953.1 50S ribosomal protein L29 [Mycoplasma phocimorsus]MDJ1647401.1 50S ribosomal protein L29 [Mycoplasma phocimorsus]MDJ1648347.1 50S ribosomal protein L29 [Mycoplasma phocimorsus]